MPLRSGGNLNLVNTATVTSSTTDPVTTNNTSTTSTPTTPTADLTVTKSFTGSAVPGQTASWSLTVTNNGPSTAVNPRLSDTVPPSVTGLTATPDATAAAAGWACTIGSGNAVSCGDDALAPGASATIVVSGTIAATATGTLDNQATVTSATADPDAASNTAATATPLTPQADVSLAKAVAPASPVPGQVVTYTLTVRNAGPSQATGLSVTDALPAGLSNLAVSTSSSALACTIAGSDLSCTEAVLAVGASGTITVTGTLDPAFTGTLTNTASVTTTTADPNADNNTATATATVAPSADLAVSKRTPTASPSPRPLPQTGTDVSLAVVAAGLALLLAGGVLLAARRRTAEDPDGSVDDKE